MLRAGEGRSLRRTGLDPCSDSPTNQLIRELVETERLHRGLCSDCSTASPSLVSKNNLGRVCCCSRVSTAEV